MGVWQGWGSSLGPGPLRHAPGACSRSWGPLPGVVYLTVHTLGPQGVTQPCSPHSSSAMQPVGPHSPETEPVLGGGQEQPLRDTPLPSWPQPFAAVSLSLLLSLPQSICVYQFLPPSFSGNVPVCLSLRSLSGTKSGDTSALLSGSEWPASMGMYRRNQAVGEDPGQVKALDL